MKYGNQENVKQVRTIDLKTVLKSIFSLQHSLLFQQCSSLSLSVFVFTLIYNDVLMAQLECTVLKELT